MIDDILQELSAISGLIGACVYYPASGAIERAMPEYYSDHELEETGRSLVAVYESGSNGQNHIRDLAFYADNKLVVLKKMTDNAFLYLLAEPDANLFLLRIALDLLGAQEPNPSRPTGAAPAE
jgi:predicted regulator of Ras-like GTPase activity (Roadblock/LC7/MglB family)